MHVNSPPSVFACCPAKILIVGEAPGQTEEAQCKPFVGESGQLLTSMLNRSRHHAHGCELPMPAYRPPNKMELWAPTKKKDIKPKVSH